MLPALLSMPSFCIRRVLCVLTVFGLRCNRSAISPSGPPAATILSTCSSRSLKLSCGSSLPAPELKIMLSTSAGSMYLPPAATLGYEFG